jgi:hypothetical protein
MRIRFVRFFFLVMLAAASAWAQAPATRTVFPDVKIRFSRGNDRLLVEKGADLVFDDAANRLMLKSGDRPFDAPYDAVRKVVLERSLRGTDPTWALAAGGLVGAALHPDVAVASWAYIESEGSPPLLLLVSKESAPRLREKMLAAFTSRVTVAQFPEMPQKIDVKTLKEATASYDVRADKTQHPVPELKPGEALIVVACPPINTRYAGKGDGKIYLNDRVVAANEMGSYTFFYAPPGEHLIVSEMGNASGIRMSFEPGKDYYFLQNTSIGWTGPETLLSRQSKELVMYEVGGSYLATWKKK